MEFAQLSTRAGGLSYAFATYDSLHPKELLSFLIPDIFGSAVDGTYWRSSEIWHFWESCGYVSIIALFFVFVRIENSSIRRLSVFFVLMMVLSLFLALGKNNPLYLIIYRLPGFNTFRIPAQIIFLYVFGIAVVSGIGMHRVQEDDWRFNRGFLPFFLFAGVLLLFFVAGLTLSPFHFFFHLFRNLADGSVSHANMDGLYDRVSFSVNKTVLLFFCSSLLLIIRKTRRLDQWTFTILVSMILMVDLYLFGVQLIKTHEIVTTPEKNSIVAQLSNSPARGRVVATGNPFETNDGLRYRFPSILGYDPLILRRYVHYTQSSQNYRHDNHVVNLAYINTPGSKLIKMLNVKQVVSNGQVKNLDNGIPYAGLVNEVVIRPEDEVLAFLRSDQFDPGNMVVLEPAYGAMVFPTGAGDEFKGSCSVVEYDNENMRIKTSSDQPAYLVLSEIFYPGWQATVDGKRTSILRGNYIFRVVPLTKGNHEVHLRFVSWPFRMGALISLMTLIGSLWFILKTGKKRKR